MSSTAWNDPRPRPARTRKRSRRKKTADEILRLKDTLNGILSKHSGKPVEEVAKDSDRDFFMGAAEAKEYGLIDEIVETAK